MMRRVLLSHVIPVSLLASSPVPFPLHCWARKGKGQETRHREDLCTTMPRTVNPFHCWTRAPPPSPVSRVRGVYYPGIPQE